MGHAKERRFDSKYKHEFFNAQEWQDQISILRIPFWLFTECVGEDKGRRAKDKWETSAVVSLGETERPDRWREKY